MVKTKKILKKQRELLDERIKKEVPKHRSPRPEGGWLKLVRECLGLSSTALSKRMGLSSSYSYKLEEREKTGSVTLASLSKSAEALGCELVYNIVPKDGLSLDSLLEKKCSEYAKKTLEDVWHSMKLEGQALTKIQKKKQLEELTKKLKDSLNPQIWGK